MQRPWSAASEKPEPACQTKEDAMSDKIPTPVSGNPASKGAPDGVSDVPGGNDTHEIHGRSSGGESGGGAYPNPHTGKVPTNTGFMKHGGQTEIAYHGGGQAGVSAGSAPNAVTGSGGDRGKAGEGGLPVEAADRTERDVPIEGHDIKVVETSGTAEAEASGKVGTDAAYEREQKQPGSG